MHDYIITKLAADRADTLRSEAAAHRRSKLFSRRADKLADRIPRQTRRSLRAAH